MEPPDQGVGPGSRPLPQLVGDLTMSVWGLAALASADETGLLDELGEPGSAQALAQRTGLPAPLVESLMDVLVALGLVRREGRVFVAEPTLIPALSGPGRSALRAELRSNLLQSARMVAGAGQGDTLVGWRHTDPRILQAQGQRSAPLVSLWAEHVFPGLEGLLERLEGSDGAFLDVGVGVAALPIGMCHRFPRLRAVGVDPLEPALVEARRNIEAAQLADRIDLRAERFEHLEEDSAYDLIHIPTMFAPAQMLPGWFERARRALRPGGWVLLQMLDRRGDGLRQAVLGLWTTLWGGGVLLPEQAQGMLADAAYERTGVLPSMPGPPVVHVVGRRPLT